MLKDRLYQLAMILVIVFGIAGVPLLTQTGCETLFVKDAETGQVREATPEEELAIRGKVIQETAATVSYVLAATGHPEYAIFVQLAGQLALALTALWINNKRNGLPPPESP